MLGTTGTGLGIGPIIWVVGSGRLIMTIGLASTDATDVTKLTPMMGTRALVNRKEFGAGFWQGVLNIVSPGKIAETEQSNRRKMLEILLQTLGLILSGRKL